MQLPGLTCRLPLTPEALLALRVMRRGLRVGRDEYDNARHQDTQQHISRCESYRECRRAN